MIERYRPGADAEGEQAPPSNRFPPKGIDFIPTGCTMLDCVIGGRAGGWPLGRAVNVVGDRSSGKTLLAEEGFANFFRKYPKGDGYYREAEAAFDLEYAKSIGTPVDKIDFGPEGVDTLWQTIESIIDDIRNILDKFDATVDAKVAEIKKKSRGKKFSLADATKKVLATMQPIFYVIDSLDALSSLPELERAADKKRRNGEDGSGTYNLEKQKLLGALFRTEVRRMRRARMCLMIISQVRERIGPMIRGDKYTRTGGKALDFYASVVIYLSQLGKVPETQRGIKRIVGIRVRAKCQKNKIAMAFRECEFEIRFGYGIDDDWACLDYLKSVNRLSAAGFGKMPDHLDGVNFDKLRADTIRVWNEIEEGFLPPKGKYVD